MAQVCLKVYPLAMQAYLKKHGPGHAGHSLKVEWEVDGLDVILQFTVQKRSSRPWLSDEVLTHDWAKNWGLWNKDVVEAFLQLRTDAQDLKAPYLEIQVSPLNQPFALIITEPRKIFHAPKILDFIHEVSVEQKVWNATMKLKLPSELRGSLVYGGFFACLDHEPREFYALEPNPEQQPDFHRPELFFPLNQL
jgi:hypothetical protein